jgi:hypothetical protein
VIALKFKTKDIHVTVIASESSSTTSSLSLLKCLGVDIVCAPEETLSTVAQQVVKETPGSLLIDFVRFF